MPPLATAVTLFTMRIIVMFYKEKFLTSNHVQTVEETVNQELITTDKGIMCNKEAL